MWRGRSRPRLLVLTLNLTLGLTRRNLLLIAFAAGSFYFGFFSLRFIFRALLVLARTTLRLRIRISVRRRCRSRGFFRVVGYIPSRPLELHRWGRNGLLHSSATVGAFLHVTVGELLDSLKELVTLFTLVFVKWHGLRQISQSRKKLRFGCAEFDSRACKDRSQFRRSPSQHSLQLFLSDHGHAQLFRLVKL